MKTIDIRQKLHQYIETAQYRKVKAIYTMVEDDIDDSIAEYDDVFFAEIERRNAEMEKGEIETYTWQEVQARAKESLQKARTKI